MYMSPQLGATCSREDDVVKYVRHDEEFKTEKLVDFATITMKR